MLRWLARSFLCKSYGGGTFWSGVHCSAYNALIERIVSVPDGMPFDQQVALADQDRAAAAALVQPPPPVVVEGTPVPNHQARCRSPDAQIRQWDTMAREPQTAQMQDWITVQRRKVRDRQLRLRC